MTVLLVVLAVGFAFSMGAHYTGACMGMPHALRAVTAWQALAIMAPLTFVGAALASHGVAHTVGHGLVTGQLTVTAQVVVIGVAFALTTLFNVLRVPTSTIQILVFTVAGVALAAGAGVQWATIGILAAIWAAAPLSPGCWGSCSPAPSTSPRPCGTSLPPAPSRGHPVGPRDGPGPGRARPRHRPDHGRGRGLVRDGRQ
ncbi:inorganic phosphate transporter [Sinomonas atrocyanea]